MPSQYYENHKKDLEKLKGYYEQRIKSIDRLLLQEKVKDE